MMMMMMMILIKQMFFNVQNIRTCFNGTEIFIHFARYFRLLPACRPMENSFQCDSGMCIPAILQCNGVDDCDDGSDEKIDCRKCDRSNVDFLSFSSCKSIHACGVVAFSECLRKRYFLIVCIIYSTRHSE